MSETARILVIDDDESIRRTISKALEMAGYKVDTADNGTEALEKAQANFYNLALIDIRLPDMQGTKLLTAMKDTTPRMAKIILTGYPALDNAIEAVNKGADSYITKPVKMDKLLAVVKEQLKKQQKENEYNQQKLAEYVETKLKTLESK
jgi:DNA-binding NtrC family response regulator